MPDELYAELQKHLVAHPEAGDLIPGCRGLRKIRWQKSDKGKRGGVRVIYYWLTKDEQIFMVHAYSKSKTENLTKDQLKQLAAIVQEELCNE